MNRFRDSSLRGGIPKTLTTMKKYITPKTISQDFLRGGVLCGSQDGKGLLGGGNPDDKVGTAPKF